MATKGHGKRPRITLPYRIERSSSDYSICIEYDVTDLKNKDAVERYLLSVYDKVSKQTGFKAGLNVFTKGVKGALQKSFNSQYKTDETVRWGVEARLIMTDTKRPKLTKDSDSDSDSNSVLEAISEHDTLFRSPHLTGDGLTTEQQMNQDLLNRIDDGSNDPLRNTILPGDIRRNTPTSTTPPRRVTPVSLQQVSGQTTLFGTPLTRTTSVPVFSRTPTDLHAALTSPLPLSSHSSEERQLTLAHDTQNFADMEMALTRRDEVHQKEMENLQIALKGEFDTQFEALQQLHSNQQKDAKAQHENTLQLYHGTAQKLQEMTDAIEQLKQAMAATPTVIPTAPPAPDPEVQQLNQRVHDLENEAVQGQRDRNNLGNELADQAAKITGEMAQVNLLNTQVTTILSQGVKHSPSSGSQIGWAITDQHNTDENTRLNRGGKDDLPEIDEILFKEVDDLENTNTVDLITWANNTGKQLWRRKIRNFFGKKLVKGYHKLTDLSIKAEVFGKYEKYLTAQHQKGTRLTQNEYTEMCIQTPRAWVLEAKNKVSKIRHKTTDQLDDLEKTIMIQIVEETLIIATEKCKKIEVALTKQRQDHVRLQQEMRNQLEDWFMTSWNRITPGTQMTSRLLQVQKDDLDRITNDPQTLFLNKMYMEKVVGGDQIVRVADTTINRKLLKQCQNRNGMGFWCESHEWKKIRSITSDDTAKSTSVTVVSDIGCVELIESLIKMEVQKYHRRLNESRNSANRDLKIKEEHRKDNYAKQQGLPLLIRKRQEYINNNNSDCGLHELQEGPRINPHKQYQCAEALCYLHFHEFYSFKKGSDPTDEGSWTRNLTTHTNKQCKAQQGAAKEQRITDMTMLYVSREGKVRRRDEQQIRSSRRGRSERRTRKERSLSFSSKSRSRSRSNTRNGARGRSKTPRAFRGRTSSRGRSASKSSSRSRSRSNSQNRGKQTQQRGRRPQSQRRERQPRQQQQQQQQQQQKECRYGKDCTRQNCRFVHPERPNRRERRGNRPRQPRQPRQPRRGNTPVVDPTAPNQPPTRPSSQTSTHETNEVKAKRRNSRKNKKTSCKNCGKDGHRSFQCDKETKCFKCGQTGHIAKSCLNSTGQS